MFYAFLIQTVFQSYQVVDEEKSFIEELQLKSTERMIKFKSLFSYLSEWLTLSYFPVCLYLHFSNVFSINKKLFPFLLKRDN